MDRILRACEITVSDQGFFFQHWHTQLYAINDGYFNARRAFGSS